MIIFPRISDSLFGTNFIDTVEEKYNAKFVLECPHWFSNSIPSVLFYVSTPSKPEYSNYFLMYRREGSFYVSDGLKSAQEKYVGYETYDGWVNSRYTHDYRKVTESLAIDGGNSYTRLVGDISSAIAFTRVYVLDGNLIKVSDDLSNM